MKREQSRSGSPDHRPRAWGGGWQLLVVSLLVRPLTADVILSEDFEDGGAAPAGWTQAYFEEDPLGEAAWIFQNGGLPGAPPNAAHGGDYNAFLHADETTLAPETALISPPIDFGSKTTSPTLTFWLALPGDPEVGFADELTIYYRDAGGAAWTALTTLDTESSVWTRQSIELPSPSQEYQVAFGALSFFGQGVAIDDVEITAAGGSGAEDPPSIVTEPTGLEVAPGQPFQFVVEAAGAPPLSYQWFKDGAPLSGATAATFGKAAASAEDAGQYHVRISNTLGALDSAPATLVVTANPGTSAQWREVWETFSRRYSYFGYKEVNWDQVWTDHEHDFDAIHDGTDFALRLNEILQILHDWHVAVRKPDGNYIGYEGNLQINYNPNHFYARYTDGDGATYENVNDAGVIYHARLDGNFAHIVITTLSTSAFSAISDGDIGNLFVHYQDAAGMIMDIRENSGGNEANARKFAERFTDRDRIFGYTRARIPGDDRNAFEDYAAKVLNPSPRMHYTGPVVCLVGQRVMSSAEWFTLMLRSIPGVVLIGDQTRGASANPAEFEIPSLNVNYLVSRWIAYDAQKQPFEDVGISPDIRIPPGADSYDDERDYVLERAMAVLSAPHLAIMRQVNPAEVAVTWHGRAGEFYTLLRSANLRDWEAVPDWQNRKAETDGVLTYTASSTKQAEFFRVRQGL